MIITMLFIATGLTLIIDLGALSIMWIKNNEALRNIERYLTNEKEEREIKEAMEEIEVL